MTLDDFIIAYSIWTLVGLCGYMFIHEDGHKRLLAKFVRFVESRKRKKRKLHKKRRGT